MDELIAFMNARLDEDEAAAKAAESAFSMDQSDPRRARSPWIAAGSLLLAAQPDGSHGDIAEVVNYGLDGVLDHAARHDPARVLREVAAKRAILARYESETQPSVYAPEPEVQELIDQRTQVLEDVLHDLAAVWSDHADYRPEWGR